MTGSSLPVRVRSTQCVQRLNRQLQTTPQGFSRISPNEITKTKPVNTNDAMRRDSFTLLSISWQESEKSFTISAVFSKHAPNQSEHVLTVFSNALRISINILFAIFIENFWRILRSESRTKVGENLSSSRWFPWTLLWVQFNHLSRAKLEGFWSQFCLSCTLEVENRFEIF